MQSDRRYKALVERLNRDLDVFRQPAWRDVPDPIERIFSLLARCRQLIVETDYRHGYSIGSLALEIHEPDAAILDLLGANFRAWTDALLKCLLETERRLPDELDRLSLAEFVLIVMEGASMQARTFRDVAYFDRAVQELRNYIELLLYRRLGPSDPVRQALAGIGRNRH